MEMGKEEGAELIRGEGLIERATPGDGAAVQADEVGVFVITRDGELVESGDYLLGPLQKAQPGASSRQLAEPSRHPKWAAPRLPMTDLLLFYDFNVWHRRCVLLKAMLVVGLGYQVMDGEHVVYDPRKDRVVPDHPAARFVARPNENLMETLSELAYRFLVDFYATGNGYLETVLRPAKRRVEQVFRLLLGEVHSGSWVRFAEMDVTDLRADGDFFDKMLERGVFKPEEVREFVVTLLQ